MKNYSSSEIKVRLNTLKARHLMTSKTIRKNNSRINSDNLLMGNKKHERHKIKDEIAGYSFI